MNKFKKVARGSILIFFGSILGSLFAYFTRMVLTRKISVQDYGLLAAVFSFVTLFEIFRNLGIYSALIKYVAQSFALQKKEEGKKIILVSILTETLLAGVIALILKSFDTFLALHYFKQPFATFVLNWLLIYFILETISSGIHHSFLGIEKAEFFLFKKPLLNILSFIFVILLPIKDARLPIIAQVIGLGGVVVISSYFFFRSFRPLVKIHWSDFKIFLPKLLKFGIPTMIASMGAMAIAQFDTLMLTYLRTLKEVGIYNVVLPTALILGFIGDAVSRVIFPLTSELEAKKEFSKIEKGLFTAYRFTLVPAVLISLPLLLFPGFILGLFFGNDYIVGGRALQILLIGVLFSIIGGINLSTIYGLGYPKFGAKVTLGAALLNIGLNLFLIPQFGIMGAAIATFFSYFLIALLSFWFLQRKIKMSFPVKFFSYLFLAWLIAFAFGNFGIKSLFENFSPLWQAIYGSILTGVVFVLLVLALKIFQFQDFYRILSIFKISKNNEQK